MSATAMSEDEKKGLLEAIRAWFRRIKEWMHNHSMPAVFEKQLDAIKQRMDEFDEQDEIHSDCLRDVAETLERITGVLEGGNLKNATPEEVEEKLSEAINALDEITKKAEKPFTVSGKTFDDVLHQALGIYRSDLYKDNIDGVPELSRDVHILLDKKEGKPADVILALKFRDEEGEERFSAMKINVVKNEKDGTEKMMFTSANVQERANGFVFGDSDRPLEVFPMVQYHQIEGQAAGVQSGENLRTLPLERIIGKAFFHATVEYQQARIAKGMEIAKSLAKISGTPEQPYEQDEYQCINDERGYCIKDRLNDCMLALRYSKEEHALIATYYRGVTEGFTSPEPPVEVVRLERTPNGNPRYSIATNANADKILDTPMAQHFLSQCGIEMKSFNSVRHTDNEKLGGAHVVGELSEKMILLRNEIEKKLRSTSGLENYTVFAKSIRHGKESQVEIKTPDQSRYIINFDKNGDVKTQFWRERDSETGKLLRAVPIIRSGKSQIDKVLNKNSFRKPELCVCYSVTRECSAKVAEILKDQNASRDAERMHKSARVESLAHIKTWVALAEAGIRANGIGGRLDDNTLVNIIMQEAEKQDGRYPDADYKEALSKNLPYIYTELSENGVILDAFSKIISVEENPVVVPERFIATGISEDDEERKSQTMPLRQEEPLPPAPEAAEIPLHSEEHYEPAREDFDDIPWSSDSDREAEQEAYLREAAQYGDDEPEVVIPESVMQYFPQNDTLVHEIVTDSQGQLHDNNALTRSRTDGSYQLYGKPVSEAEAAAFVRASHSIEQRFITDAGLMLEEQYAQPAAEHTQPKAPDLSTDDTEITYYRIMDDGNGEPRFIPSARGTATVIIKDGEVHLNPDKFRRGAEITAAEIKRNGLDMVFDFPKLNESSKYILSSVQPARAGADKRTNDYGKATYRFAVYQRGSVTAIESREQGERPQSHEPKQPKRNER